LIVEAMCLQKLGQSEHAREVLKECDRIVGAKFTGETAIDPAFLRPFELSPFFLRREAGQVIE
jgi:hypothetical protein